ncbi:MAG: L-lactate dehydrogenase [Chloroflexi bacterium HGW-Chloroflexi-6]|nr:MAG: L-lactate dehydrogenase [Chloroflexi bacterium HGW-Chloroflexi-6]
MFSSRKVVIVGAGAVGSSFAYALAQKGIADEIALSDINRDYAEGQVLDLAHGLPFYPNIQIKVGTDQDYADAAVIVITAGAKQMPGESRLNLLQKNAAMIEGIIDKIVAQNSKAVIVIASNPVDILTHVAIKRSGWPKTRVIGSGTVLDSSRFRYLLSKHCDVDVTNVHAYILGEHGDSEFPAWSMTHVGGIPIEEYCPQCATCGNWELEKDEIARQVKESAYHIINYKGATYYAIGMALVRITAAILQDQNSVLTVSTLLEGEYGLRDVCLSIPAMLGKDGIKRITEAKLTPEEQTLLEKSAETLRKSFAELSQEQTA